MQSAQRKLEYPMPASRPKKRVVKMEGNVAYIDSGFAKQKVRQPQAAPRKKTVARRAVKHKTGIASTLFVLVIAFAAMALLVSRYAAVCSVSAQNNALEQQISETEAKIDRLQVDLELKEDIEYVHNAAQQQLGMQYPAQSQKIKIDLGG